MWHGIFTTGLLDIYPHAYKTAAAIRILLKCKKTYILKGLGNVSPVDAIKAYRISSIHS
jgi:hypothetical protein